MEENKNTKFEIPIEGLIEGFQAHLNLENNKRIIFSGPFGTGKTYFLKKFFEKEERSTFHLYPVNYSVSRNEDIFELIKYDLLYQLLDDKREIDFEKVDYTLSERTYLTLNNPSNDTIVSGFLKYVPKIGKVVSEVYDNVPKLVDQIAPKELKNEKKKAEEVVRKTENTTGSAYEFDDISGLIYKLILQVKEKHGKATLIIDDLDRIDPEHIFRLLNVFAAHFDIDEEENKFGFDQVIFVCDIENIRNIFSAKYGQDTDFSGYIDKFFSREVYVFDNSKIIENLVEELIRKYKYSDTINDVYVFDKEHIIATKVLNNVLKILSKKNAINLRSLLKFSTFTYSYNPYEQVSFGSRKFYMHQIHFVNIFTILTSMFGTYAGLDKAFSKVQNMHWEVDNDKIIGSLIMIIDWKHHQFNISSNICIFRYNNKYYEYQVYEERDFYYGRLFRSKKDDESDSLVFPDGFMELFRMAAIELKNLNIIK
ncbi:P-loop NTPase fold protein [Cytophagaceae bacterium ABcell3]|nr:P-loop NTPase fold protein [Cytophagaceae bacterium ABcell3]